MAAAKPIRKPTIIDVARRARVSLGTVSNVLNGNANVSDARQARVSAAIRALGYVPNGVAQSLRRSASRVVGLCTPSASNAYFAALLDAFEEVAVEHGYELMHVQSRGDPERELRRIGALLARNVDGLIVIPSVDPRAALDLIEARGKPAVLVDRLMADPRFDYVGIDDRAAARSATRHLIELGHRRLLYIVSNKRLITTRRRIEGFRDAARRGPSDVDAVVLQRDADEAAFAVEITNAMQSERRPTAIIASNSAIALSFVRVLQTLRLRWPDDVSVLAFDEPEWAEIVAPALAVIRHPTRAIARHAWDRLLGRMQHDELPRTRTVLSAEFVVGGSLGPPGAFGHTETLAIG